MEKLLCDYVTWLKPVSYLTVPSDAPGCWAGWHKLPYSKMVREKDHGRAFWQGMVNGGALKKWGASLSWQLTPSIVRESANNHESLENFEFQERTQPSRHVDCSLVAQWAGEPVKLYLTSAPQDCVLMNICYVKHLSLCTLLCSNSYLKQLPSVKNLAYQWFSVLGMYYNDPNSFSFLFQLIHRSGSSQRIDWSEHFERSAWDILIIQKSPGNPDDTDLNSKILLVINTFINDNRHPKVVHLLLLISLYSKSHMMFSTASETNF